MQPRPPRDRQSDMGNQRSTTFEVTCPCCKAILTVDAEVRAVLAHREPPRTALIVVGSLPSTPFGNTWISIAPLVRSFTSSANRSAAVCQLSLSGCGCAKRQRIGFCAIAELPMAAAVAANKVLRVIAVIGHLL